MKLRNKKTGEIVDTKDYNFKIATPAEPLYGHDAFDVREEYNSLAELNADWEDYKPSEPLIKDEKIRKTVRAWAEMHGIKRVHYIVYAHNNKLAYIEGADEDNKVAKVAIDIITISELKDLEYYTIAELCGEEE